MRGGQIFANISSCEEYFTLQELNYLKILLEALDGFGMMMYNKDNNMRGTA